MRVLHGGCKGKASVAPCLQEHFGMADLVINQHRLILTDDQIKRPWTIYYTGKTAYWWSSAPHAFWCIPPKPHFGRMSFGFRRVKINVFL
jgi:hypothetical protein